MSHTPPVPWHFETAGGDHISPAQQREMEAAWERESAIDAARGALEQCIAKIEVQNKRFGELDDTIAGLRDLIGDLPR